MCVYGSSLITGSFVFCSKKCSMNFSYFNFLFGEFQKSDHTNLTDLSNSMIDVAWTFVLILSVCELGEKVTNHFELFDEELCNCDWLSFPLEIQRLYLIVLLGAEQPGVIQGYAQTACTRSTFKKAMELIRLSISKSNFNK